MYILSCGADLVYNSADSLHEVARYQVENSVGDELNIVDLSWSIDGKKCLFVSSNELVQILHLDTYKNALRIKETININRPTCCGFAKDRCDQFAIGNYNGNVYISDLQEKNKQLFLQSNAPILALDFFNIDSILAVGNIRGVIYVLDEYFTLQKTYCFPDSNSLSNLRCHPTRRGYFGATSNSGAVIVWDIKYLDPKMCQFYANLSHTACCTDLAFSRTNPMFLATVGYDKIINCYDMGENEVVLKIMTDKDLQSLDINIDGLTVVVGDVLGGMTIYDLRTCKKPISYLEKVHSKPTWHVSFWASKYYTSHCNVSEDVRRCTFKVDNPYYSIWHILGQVDNNMNFIPVPSNKSTVQFQNKMLPCKMLKNPKTCQELQKQSFINSKIFQYEDDLFDDDSEYLNISKLDNLDKTDEENLQKNSLHSTKSKVKQQLEKIAEQSAQMQENIMRINCDNILQSRMAVTNINAVITGKHSDNMRNNKTQVKSPCRNMKTDNNRNESIVECTGIEEIQSQKSIKISDLKLEDSNHDFDKSTIEMIENTQEIYDEITNKLNKHLSVENTSDITVNKEHKLYIKGEILPEGTVNIKSDRKTASSQKDLPHINVSHVVKEKMGLNEFLELDIKENGNSTVQERAERRKYVSNNSQHCNSQFKSPICLVSNSVNIENNDKNNAIINKIIHDCSNTQISMVNTEICKEQTQNKLGENEIKTDAITIPLKQKENGSVKDVILSKDIVEETKENPCNLTEIDSGSTNEKPVKIRQQNVNSQNSFFNNNETWERINADPKTNEANSTIENESEDFKSELFSQDENKLKDEDVICDSMQNEFMSDKTTSLEKENNVRITEIADSFQSNMEINQDKPIDQDSEMSRITEQCTKDIGTLEKKHEKFIVNSSKYNVMPEDIHSESLLIKQTDKDKGKPVITEIKHNSLNLKTDKVNNINVKEKYPKNKTKSNKMCEKENKANTEIETGPRQKETQTQETKNRINNNRNLIIKSKSEKCTKQSKITAKTESSKKDSQNPVKDKQNKINNKENSTKSRISKVCVTQNRKLVKTVTEITNKIPKDKIPKENNLRNESKNIKIHTKLCDKENKTKPDYTTMESAGKQNKSNFVKDEFKTNRIVFSNKHSKTNADIESTNEESEIKDVKNNAIPSKYESETSQTETKLTIKQNNTNNDTQKIIIDSTKNESEIQHNESNEYIKEKSTSTESVDNICNKEIMTNIQINCTIIQNHGKNNTTEEKTDTTESLIEKEKPTIKDSSIIDNANNKNDNDSIKDDNKTELEYENKNLTDSKTKLNLEIESDLKVPSKDIKNITTGTSQESNIKLNQPSISKPSTQVDNNIAVRNSNTPPSTFYDMIKWVFSPFSQ